MIQSFKCKATKKLFNRFLVRKISTLIQRAALRKLLMLDAAISINDLRMPPSNRLELLGGNMKGKYSIRINKKWRICFEWNNGNAYNVEIIDYH